MTNPRQLLARLNEIAGEAKNTANQLTDLGGRLKARACEVEQTVGGSATQVDKQMIDTLRAAEHRAAEAVAALQAVGRAAKNYGPAL